MKLPLGNPIPWIVGVLAVLTVLWEAIGAPIRRLRDPRSGCRR